MSQLLITDELDAVAEHSTTEVPSVLNRSKMIFSGVGNFSTGKTNSMLVVSFVNFFLIQLNSL